MEVLLLHETERKVHLVSPWFSHLHFGGETVQRIKSIYHSKCKMVSVLSHLTPRSRRRASRAGRRRRRSRAASGRCPSRHYPREALPSPASALPRSVVSGLRSPLEGQSSSAADVLSDSVSVVRVPVQLTRGAVTLETPALGPELRFQFVQPSSHGC